MGEGLVGQAKTALLEMFFIVLSSADWPLNKNL